MRDGGCEATEEIAEQGSSQFGSSGEKCGTRVSRQELGVNESVNLIIIFDKINVLQTHIFIIKIVN